MMMQNFTDCKMKEATFLQEVAYVGLKCLGFIHFTQDKGSRLERLFCFPLAIRNSGKHTVIAVRMVTGNVVLDWMVFLHNENSAWSTSFTGTYLPSRQKQLQGLLSQDCYSC